MKEIKKNAIIGIDNLYELGCILDELGIEGEVRNIIIMSGRESIVENSAGQVYYRPYNNTFVIGKYASSYDIARNVYDLFEEEPDTNTPHVEPIAPPSPLTTPPLSTIAPPSDVNHPEYYHPGTYEAINVIEAWNLGFNLGNVVKYISRAGSKDAYLKELKKAAWYLSREIDKA